MEKNCQAGKNLNIECYNEADNLPLLVARCTEVVKRDDIEIILVDNGSTDTSPQVLQTLISNHRFIRSVRVEKNQGYGFGILSGLRAGRGEMLGWTHADLQTDPNDAMLGLELMEKTPNWNRCYVKGKRYGRPFMDVVFTMGMSLFETLLLGKRFWDINAQPNLFPRSFFETWNNPPHDFSLDLYVYYQAQQSGLILTRFPVRFGKRAHGVSHWNIHWKSKVKFIRRTIDFSLALRKGIKTLP